MDIEHKAEHVEPEVENMPVLQRKYVRLSVIAGAVVVLDQATKAAVLALMPLYESIAVIPGFFNLSHIHNPGGAFGFMAGMSGDFRRLLFIGFSLLAMGFILWFYRQTAEKSVLVSFGLSLIFGGAVGNLIDRLRFGRVVDFLDFYIGSYHWPAFNIADSAVTVGVAIFAYCVLFKDVDL